MVFGGGGYAIVHCPLASTNMGKLRISIVEFLNTAPLVWGFTDGPLAGKYDLSFAVPSQCAEDLRAGRADVGIIPSIEYQRMENVVALPGMAVAAKNEVRSLLVVSKVPIEMAKSFALDTNSRSSVGLARILSQRHWNIAPEFIDIGARSGEDAGPRGCRADHRRSRAAPAAEGGCAASQSAARRRAAVAAAARMNSPSRDRNAVCV